MQIQEIQQNIEDLEKQIMVLVTDFNKRNNCDVEQISLVYERIHRLGAEPIRLLSDVVVEAVL